MTYQSPVQWSITKDLYSWHICCFVLLLVASDQASADVTNSMWASLYKQASICQRYASILKVVFLFSSVFYICYLLW